MKKILLTYLLFLCVSTIYYGEIKKDVPPILIGGILIGA